MGSRSEKRRGHKPQFGVTFLEKRELLTAWPDVFARFEGEITAADVVDEFPVLVRRQDFGAPRRSLVLGFDLRASDGSLFDPGTLTLLLNRPGDARILHRDPEALNALSSVLLADVRGGTYGIEVRADAGLIGAYELGWYLAGDVNGDHQVTTRDVARIRANLGQKTGAPGVPLAADVDRDGHVTKDDLRFARLNLGAGTRVRPIQLRTSIDTKHSDPEANGLVTRGDIEIVGQTTRNSNVQVDVGDDGTFEVTATADRRGKFRITAFVGMGRTTIRVVATDELGQTTDELLQVVRTDEILNWNEVALVALRREGLSSPRAARALAMMHATVNDTLAALEDGLKSYHVETQGPATASRDAAVVSAAHSILAALLPGQHRYLATAYNGSLDALTRNSARREGIALGQQVAARILRLRSNDGSRDASTDPGSTDPGKWRPTPPENSQGQLARWGLVAPFLMRDPFALRAPAPPELNSTEYAGFYQEVKELGRVDSSTRTTEQTETARFWARLGTDLGTIAAWNRLTRDTAIDRAFSLVDNAKSFAMLNLAMADASIAAFDSKYAYDFWRPITAIREAASDGNDATAPDTSWTPLVNTPSTPGYVSAQSAYAGAAEIVLKDVFGDDFAPTIAAFGAAPGARTYSNLAEAAEEAGRSQVFAGIAFEFDNQRGLTMGRDVGRLVLQILA